jgi:hypothetical protein
MNTAPHLSKQTWANAREGMRARTVGITYTDHKPYAFEISQDVTVINPNSPFRGMTGQVINRRGGMPNKYTVHMPTLKAPVPYHQFREDELTALRFLPLPIFQWGEKDMFKCGWGKYKLSEHPDIPRRWLEHQKRVAAHKVRTPAVIEMPRYTQTTAHEKFLDFIASLDIQHTRAALYRHMDACVERWQMRRMRKAA